jgi:hypothetical protein
VELENWPCPYGKSSRAYRLSSAEYGTQEIASHGMVSFVFLNNSFVLVSTRGDRALGAKVEGFEPPDKMALHVVNFTSGDDGPTWLLEFPSLRIAADDLAMELTSDPGPLYAPHGGPVPPFHALDVNSHTGGERVIVLKVSSGDTISFTTLASKLIALTQSYPMLEGDTCKRVTWEQWGPQSCCTDYSTRWLQPWVCVVYGTRHVYYRKSRRTDGMLVIRDFCQRRLKWEETRQCSPWQAARVAHGTGDQQESAFDQTLDQQTLPIHVCNGDNKSRCPPLAKMLRSLFSEEVSANLPYIEIEIPCTISGHDQVMLSEDSVVIVKVRLYVILLRDAYMQYFAQGGIMSETKFEVYSV